MTYQLLLTTLGQQKLSAAASAGGQPVRITEFAVGQGVDVDFSKRLDQQVLVSKRYQSAVESVTATNVAGQYEVVCIVPKDAGGWAIREIGLIDSEGSLIWVGQVPEVQKPVASSTAAVDYRIKVVISIDNPDVNLVIDANVVTATQAWVANNFVSNPRFAQFLDLAYPYGHKYWTHNKSNPKPLFDAMFGFETHWRRLEGVGLVAVKDNDAYIGQPMLTLGQRGTTELATTERPHTYPAYTSYLFERYNPDDVVETVWQVSADKTAIAEGKAVRFTVTANNLPDGQILDWAVKEGALSADSNDIDAPEKSENGTVILKNGQAVIDFVTTPDDNEEEPQKHVRLTVGAPANLSINVPINDAGHNETVVHISQSTTDGINLAEYYKTQYGAYPSADDIVRFVVGDGVDIIAPDTTTPAMTEGANWPTGNAPIVENHGRILGRGGAGGKPPEYDFSSSNYTLSSAVTYDPTDGGDGGTAISGSIKIDNYGLVAGGGGGGGAGGFFIITDNPNGFGIGGGGGSGGGAPYGKNYPNLRSLESYYRDVAFDDHVALPSLNNPISGLTYDVYSNIYIVSQHDEYGNAIRGEIFSGEPLKSDLVRFGVNVGTRLQGNFTARAYSIPHYVDETKSHYRIYSWGSDRLWVDGMKQSTSADFEHAGTGGYSLFSDNGGTHGFSNHPTANQSIIDATKNSGGSGGSWGEDGNKGLLSEFFVYRLSTDGIIYTRVEQSDANIVIAPTNGGLAGYISQGNVTINNYGSGTTKGRTA